MEQESFSERMDRGGWSGRTLAAVFNVSYTTISRWRNGVNAVPNGIFSALYGAELAVPRNLRGGVKARRSA